MQSARAHEPKHPSCSAVCFYLCAGVRTETKRTWAILFQSLQLLSAGAPQSVFSARKKMISIQLYEEKACSLLILSSKQTAGPCCADRFVWAVPGPPERCPPGACAGCGLGCFPPSAFSWWENISGVFLSSCPLLVRAICAQCGLRASKGSPDRAQVGLWGPGWAMVALPGAQQEWHQNSRPPRALESWQSNRILLWEVEVCCLSSIIDL